MAKHKVWQGCGEYNVASALSRLKFWVIAQYSMSSCKEENEGLQM